MKPLWMTAIGVAMIVIGVVALRLIASVTDRFAARCETVCLPYAPRVTNGACYCARPDGTWVRKELTP